MIESIKTNNKFKAKKIRNYIVNFFEGDLMSCEEEFFEFFFNSKRRGVKIYVETFYRNFSPFKT